MTKTPPETTRNEPEWPARARDVIRQGYYVEVAHPDYGDECVLVCVPPDQRRAWGLRSGESYVLCLRDEDGNEHQFRRLTTQEAGYCGQRAIDGPA